MLYKGPTEVGLPFGDMEIMKSMKVGVDLQLGETFLLLSACNT